MTAEIEVGEISEHLFGSIPNHLAHAYEAPEALNHFHIDQVRCMELVAVSKEACLDPGAKRRLKEKLE
jgi:hypothetical protein